MPSSVKSGSGAGSRPASGAPARLRSFGASSYVDETLFGSPTAASRKAGGSPSPGRHGSPTPKAAATTPGKGSPAAALVAGGRHDALTLTKSQLERMMQARGAGRGLCASYATGLLLAGRAGNGSAPCSRPTAFC